MPQYSPLSEDACIRRENYYDKIYEKKTHYALRRTIVRGKKHANAKTKFSGIRVEVKETPTITGIELE
jgi:hypothetical protein